MQIGPSHTSPVALVVDNEPLNCISTVKVVADEGYDVIEARTAEEAIRFLDDHHSLQLVTDPETGGHMHGCELEVAVTKRLPPICAVVASGAARPSDGDLPASAIFVGKPISQDVAHEAIEEYCGKRDVR